MNSGADVAGNLRTAQRLIDDAARDGAALVLLPENFGLIGLHARDKLAAQERDGDGPQQAFLARAARQHRIHLIGGSVPIACGDATRARLPALTHRTLTTL
jgi:nitrilase